MNNEGGSTPVIIAETGGAGAFIGLYKPIEERHHARHPTSIGKAKPRRSGARAAPASQPAQWQDSVLRADSFADAVRRETRRSERSGAPLSIVRYAIDSGVASDPLHFDRLLAILQCSMRETDFLGHVSTDALVLLCPDTDAEGARGLVAKLAPVVSEMPVLPATATFPEHLFESLAGSASATEALRLFTTPAPLDRNGIYPLKRSLDIVLALIALLVFGPVMLAVALIVRATSRGPIIFRQQRLGQGGAPFSFYKFRSMVVNVDDKIHREFVANLIRGGEGAAPTADNDAASYKIKGDPRVTRIGKFIRMTSIDELPQLFNVLKGDMSMVGPRPPIPYEAAHYEPWHLRRILIGKPGITGLWQVEGRSRVSFSEMVRMDLRYIRQCSLGLDLKILARTVIVVLRCSGAR
jgi:lipopolysaccharide/colanic/teichoic acid biosynthesis glycosyltransferase